MYLELNTHHLTIPFKGTKRRVRVLLPDNYYQEQANYPVVYMHDGQNVFHSREAYTGHSWKVIPAIKRNPDLTKMIFVGIDNGGEDRMSEYTPWSIPLPHPPYQLEGRANEFADFVIEVVKKFVDEHYRTKPQAKYTAMIGSSAGANITAFMGVRYQNQIGRLGVFSLASFLIEDLFLAYINEQAINEKQRIYIQVGTEEAKASERTLDQRSLRQAYIDSSLKYAKTLAQKGLTLSQMNLNIFTGENHREQAWARHLPECLRFITKDW